MCGRVFLRADPTELLELLHRIYADLELALDAEDLTGGRYNLPPTSELPVLTAEDGHGTLQGMRWGLVPRWWSKPKLPGFTFNARSETAASKNMFRAAFARRRAVVPVSGFYEWRTAEDGSKQPFAITAEDGPGLLLAGLWAHRPARGERPAVTSATILTTGPAPALGDLHDRSPVILAPDQVPRWLEAEDATTLDDLLRPWPGPLRVVPVDPAVGSVRHTDGAWLPEDLR